MASVLDDLEDEENSKEDEFEITVSDIAEERTTEAQRVVQKRVRREVTDFVLKGLGGTPPDYSRTEVKRLWGNRWRANVITVDKKGATHYNHSYFIHYQINHIVADKQTPLTKLYSNYEEIFSTTTPEGDQS